MISAQRCSGPGGQIDMNYLHRQARGLSQALNGLLPGGSTDITLSGRCYIHARMGKRWAAIAERTIDKLFFWQERHCRLSWAADVRAAADVMFMQELLTKKE